MIALHASSDSTERPTEWAVQDVAVHIGKPSFEKESNQTPHRGGVLIAKDLWVGILDRTWIETALGTCATRTLRGETEHLAYSQTYSFVRGGRLPQDWDGDQRLQGAIALSRLIHPTSIGLSYAFRLTTSPGRLHDVEPAAFDGARGAWIASSERDWLTTSEIEQLRSLLAAYDRCPRPSRVDQALWFHEYVARSGTIEVRYAMTATAFEHLVHTDRQGSTKQFKVRTARLAGDVGLQGVTEDKAEEFYDRRCRVVHGSPGPSLGLDSLYIEFETLLQTVLRRAIEDQAFGAIFADDNRIRELG